MYLKKAQFMNMIWVNYIVNVTALSQIKDQYYALGFTDEEIVALFGRRTLGFKDIAGKNVEDRWSRNPYVFDNNYFEELLNKKSPYIKTTSDMALLEDRTFRNYIEQFSQDEEEFFRVYARAHQKMTELGCTNLLSEEVVPQKETLELI